MFDLTIKIFQIIILTLSSFAAVLTILLLLSPRIFNKISLSTNKVISPDKLQSTLEKQINTEKNIFYHSRIFSFFAVMFSAISLFILIHHRKFYNIKELIQIKSAQGWIIVFLVESVQVFFYLSLSAITLFGIYTLFFPTNLEKISLYLNKWISTEQIYRELDFFKNFDALLIKYRIPIGIISLLILSYVIYSCFIQFL